MNVTKNQIDDLNLELVLNVAAEDYAPIKKKKLNERRKTAEFKGFRKGMVPMSLVERVYGPNALVDAVNEIISEQLDKFIRENSLNIVGEPITGKNQKEVDWEDGKDFEFVFDLALNPEVKVEVTKDDEVNEYNITVTEKAKKEMKDNLRKYDESKKDKTDEELEEEVVNYLKNNYKQESAYRLSKDIRDYLVQKANLTLPEEFLKRWLTLMNKDKVDEETIEKEFPAFLQDYRWQLVRGHLMDSLGLKIEQKDIQEAAESYVRYQYAMYGMGGVPDEIVKENAKNVLTDEKQFNRVIEQVEDNKVLDAVKGIIKITPKRISVDKFRAL
ncbi:MAG: trigger factor family protein [Bacteroidales bacterium]|nr:trigger factor family protein [Bacteroidales bacterium]MBQ1905583.1 trigger factor family protein [Bacteroidales bacterium]MBQ2104915.1 trigger factor family protein [Bacteroidales bacterium]MBQ3976720.1 trigger factor family protein [Bacteroidales bacterium]MBQ3985108.1 trigger factor family protein [Bacteroidales bacterium]